DYCFLANGRLPPEIADIVTRTYAEFSPSGQGIRAFVKGKLGNHKSHRDAAHVYGFETFSSAGYVTFTGNPLPTTELMGNEDHIEPVDERVIGLCKQRFGTAEAKPEGGTDWLENFEPPLGLTETETESYLSDLDPSMGREDWIRVGMALHHETGGDGFEAWDVWSMDGHQYPGEDSLRAQWDSFDRRDPTAKRVTARSLIKMSNAVRAGQGLEPRSFDKISRAAEQARASAPEVSPDRYATPEDWGGKYRVYSGGEFAARPAPPWIIKGVLPEADLGVIYGASGSGKSFVVLDIAMSIVRGLPWRGMKTKPGRVLYIAAEGGGGVSQRLKAYAQHHNVDIGALPIGIVHDAPNLLVEEDVSELVKAIIAAGSGSLIVIDTFAQLTPGANENSGEDMGKALRHARSVRDATGSMVLLVHHSGKDASKGARGWSGIRAAADVEFEVIRPEEGDVRILRVSKQKDGRDDFSWAFKFQEVIVGQDDDGEEVSSLVVIEAELPKPTVEEPKDKRKLGVWERVILDVIDGIDRTINSLTTEDLIERAVASVPPPNEGERDFRKQSVRRALTSLTKGAEPLLFIEHGRVELGEIAA
ncbi:MAG: AAA family ATPase, partial [Alphaproteobacteria bacterium]